jgi:hypothetical protein
LKYCSWDFDWWWCQICDPHNKLTPSGKESDSLPGSESPKSDKASS